MSSGFFQDIQDISIHANSVLVSGFGRDLGRYTFVIGVIVVLSTFVDICYLISAF